ncbi:chitinase-3-like protein 2 [Anthonomus grandis grandis]|uniref:chitinase-3-like protein 2 n=1 Tax=Anthonomus grandis grandis TaxID=2921223 RepID=UPI0021660419|nr:chitinase-3-like protein 2 [Anthonomus grandis grandis]
MFSEEQNQYILLHRDVRNPWHLDKKTVLMIGCLVLPVTLFCATYMVLFGVYEKLTYPKLSLSGFRSPETVDHIQHRASVYNYINPADGFFIDIQKNSHFEEYLHSHELSKKFKLVCYYNFPSDQQSMQINDIDPNLCTHLNIAFGSVVNHSIYLDNEHLEYLKDIVKLKDKNKDLKILLSIGGAGNDNGFPEMVKNHTNRKSFIKSVLSYVKDYNIDGIDLDWEFPGEDMNYDPKQKMHFTQLLLEIRKTIMRQEKHKFLLTVAVAAPNVIVDFAYDVSYMNDYVDFVNLMSYDYHYYTGVTPFTGINSPLYAKSSELFYLATLNINYSSHYWNYKGMDKSKIVIGLPTYGHTFRLQNPRNHDLYAPASGYGKLGTSGFASYPSICNFLQMNHITPIFDMENYSPYASKYYEWISFDDDQSLTYKTEFIKSNNFGGAMVYSLNVDDYLGTCKMGSMGGKKFPLVNAVKSILEGNTS